MIAKTRATTPSMLASPTSPASNQLVEMARKRGTVTIAPTLLIAVIVTESAVSPLERWVSMLAIIPPGEAPSRTRPTASSGESPKTLAVVSASSGEISARLSIPISDPARGDQHPPEVGRGQRHAEAAHDHGDRGRQHDGGEDGAVHAARTLVDGARSVPGVR